MVALPVVTCACGLPLTLIGPTPETFTTIE
jgi:hypothetical protein